ncbi:hypothetical protein PAESOLCIP111_05898 [Paenibacillus solanacearum]|uniref:Uncharacterized protein n=1 Tax=Paenibacillus solanacearum TaxID=2048548 RepID=A0A916K8L4_9BACL|nr:hypothetical protein PAESOLCIP111_05898 [Paenibacillus solanacearum]
MVKPADNPVAGGMACFAVQRRYRCKQDTLGLGSDDFGRRPILFNNEIGTLTLMHDCTSSSHGSSAPARDQNRTGGEND